MLAGHMDAAMRRSLPTTVPLSQMPLELGAWRGEEFPLDEGIVATVAFDDEYINRRYTNALHGRAASVFVGYTGRPHKWLVHRPDICYPAHGWQRASETEFDLGTGTDSPVPCRLFEFTAIDPEQASLYVLSTFVVNGQFSSDTHVRNVRLFADEPPYIARIQVSAISCGRREADLAVLEDLTRQLLRPLRTIMPYWEP